VQPKRQRASLIGKLAKMIKDEDIIEGCIRNERKMQKALYEKYSPTLYAICLRYAKSPEEAQDILQEGFIKVYRYIKQFSREHSFEGWLKRIFVNTSITHYKQNLKHYYQQDIDELKETRAVAGNYTEVDFTKEELLNVIGSISDGYRMVFNMYAIEGYKHKEIADALGIDVATSKSQYHRAKKVIQQKLEELAKEKMPDE